MIIAGVGFSSQCSAEELADLVRQAQAAAGRAATALAAPEGKAEAACLTAAAVQLLLPIFAIAPEELAEADGRVATRSARSQIAAGVGSVAEAAALAAAGPGSRLTLARIASAHATCALSEGDPP